LKPDPYVCTGILKREGFGQGIIGLGGKEKPAHTAIRAWFAFGEIERERKVAFVNQRQTGARGMIPQDAITQWRKTPMY
jgi:hypothetical protein